MAWTGTLVSRDAGVSRETSGFCQMLHAVPQRGKEWRRRLARSRRHFLARREHGATETAVRAFHLRKSWKNRADAEAGGFSAVHAGEQRIGEAVDHLRAVVALDEGRDGLVVIDGPRRMEKLLRHAQLGLPGKKRRKTCGQDLGGDHEHQAIGHHDETAVGQDVGLAVGIVGADQLIAEAKRAAKIGGPRFFGDERVWPRFDDASVDGFSAENAAEARGGFVKNVVHIDAGAALFFESEGG